jgi:hypothetical protein
LFVNGKVWRVSVLSFNPNRNHNLPVRNRTSRFAEENRSKAKIIMMTEAIRPTVSGGTRKK